ncbi:MULTISPECIES: hypothetical protein [unclassified Ruminococcus]|uniref:hypothetical protein n=1 Tax=unclassified Ruminococcus TaxID=2608920 RepID=UPI002108E973|nr:MULTISPECIES: hypothetical protein [unclassified Ruminococcus]MCQ4023303.1 hypothetical protein [Ruminococcus sp. zg-924]MCQ4115670.1 hypothetical protein [Ruminococcus sp. zg-921]
MADKGSFWDNPFGGLFDFNGDGKEDFLETGFAYNFIRKQMKKDKTDGSFSYTDSSNSSYKGYQDYSWRETCEDGYDYGVDPEDYETEEEYEEALKEAKYGWRDTCDDNDNDYGVDPEDYETEEEYEEALEEAKYGWRDTCDDNDNDYGVDPEDYETEEEYEEALKEAKYGWRDTCDDNDNDFGVDPGDYETEEEYVEAIGEEMENAKEDGCSGLADVEIPATNRVEEIKESDFPNKRRYNAAVALAEDNEIYGEQQENACCQFILEKADTILAANYLTYNGEFLYAQAVKDNFTLPVSLPDEDEQREYEFNKIIQKLAKKDIPLSFKVWSWCQKQFLPYAQYDSFAESDLTDLVIDELYTFSDAFTAELVRYLDENPDFFKNITEKGTEIPDGLPRLIAIAIAIKRNVTATALFKSGLNKACGQWRKINGLTEDTLGECKNYKELESVEFFQNELLPLVKAVDIGMVQDEIEEWEAVIAEYIDCVESECEQYAYSRKNVWRKNVPDGKKYGLDPCDYETEQEYMDALNEEKFSWREDYSGWDTLGVNPDNYETEEAFREAYDVVLNKKRSTETEKRKERKLKQNPADCADKASDNCADDNNIYIFCGVEFPNSSHLYHYRTEDKTIKIGDLVIVPAGNIETQGRVVCVGQYIGRAAPYPVSKARFIVRKIIQPE